MAGQGKKPPLMCNREIGLLFDGLSKAALIDALWCACQLGTDETSEQVGARMAREALAAVVFRGDSLSKNTRVGLDRFAAVKIDSDVEG